MSCPQEILTTDASLEGWGAVYGNESTGGRWSDVEKTDHINVLELKAVLFGLKAYFKNIQNVEILIRSDNTTTVSYINRMGGSKSSECESVAKEIWKFCEYNDLWINATHIPGVNNEHADFLSRNFTDNTEWSLNQHIFNKICEM